MNGFEYAIFVMAILAILYLVFTLIGLVIDLINDVKRGRFE